MATLNQIADFLRGSYSEVIEKLTDSSHPLLTISNCLYWDRRHQRQHR